jgi:hypothetical protein
MHHLEVRKVNDGLLGQSLEGRDLDILSKPETEGRGYGEGRGREEEEGRGRREG